MNFAQVPEHLPKLLNGLGVTVVLVGAALAAGALLAIPLALALRSRRPWLAWPASAYTFFFRGTPLLAQMFLIYYGLAQFDLVKNSPLWPFLREGWWCGFLALALNTLAYTAVLLRGGLDQVPGGELEAARALGMSPWLVLRRVLLPRALRLCLPAYGNEVILLVKASSLVSVLTVMDLMGETKLAMTRTYAFVEFLLIAGALYLALNSLVALAFHQLERSLKKA